MIARLRQTRQRQSVAFRCRTRDGTTLLEVLVVIAILGVLMKFLVFPPIQRARESARLLVCQSQLQQLALAIKKHRDDKGRLPFFYAEKGENEFMMQLAQYLGDNQAIWICPSDPKHGRGGGGIGSYYYMWVSFWSARGKESDLMPNSPMVSCRHHRYPSGPVDPGVWLIGRIDGTVTKKPGSEMNPFTPKFK